MQIRNQNIKRKNEKQIFSFLLLKVIQRHPWNLKNRTAKGNPDISMPFQSGLKAKQTSVPLRDSPVLSSFPSGQPDCLPPLLAFLQVTYAVIPQATEARI